MATAKQVIFANEEVTVHLLLGTDPIDIGEGKVMYDTESQVILPGHSVAVEKVPPYLLDAVKAGTAPGLQLMSETRANKISAEAANIRSLASKSINVQGPVSEGDKMVESVKAAALANSDD